MTLWAVENEEEVYLVRKTCMLTVSWHAHPLHPACRVREFTRPWLGPGCTRDSAGKGPGLPASSRQGICTPALKVSVLSTPEGRCWLWNVVGSGGWREGGRESSLSLSPTPDRQPYPSAGPAAPHVGEHLGRWHSNEEMLAHLVGGPGGMENKVRAASRHSSSGV